MSYTEQDLSENLRIMDRRKFLRKGNWEQLASTVRTQHLSQSPVYTSSDAESESGFADDERSDFSDDEDDEDMFCEAISETADSYYDDEQMSVEDGSEYDTAKEYPEECEVDELVESGEEVTIRVDEEVEGCALFAPVADPDTGAVEPRSAPIIVLGPLPVDGEELPVNHEDEDSEDPPMFIDPFNPFQGPLYIANYTISPDEDMKKCEKSAFEVIEHFVDQGAKRSAYLKATEKIGPLDVMEYETDSDEEEVDELVNDGGSEMSDSDCGRGLGSGPWFNTSMSTKTGDTTKCLGLFFLDKETMGC
ncbi:hypothetical protein VNI00_016563 [Paramarasmius palmivorus]|uniref:Uncharacterized protein n=1 Tax=Paramarasmius palmivorus TaxID=297713 RepID=A0AAW0BBS9_9AGAR